MDRTLLGLALALALAGAAGAADLNAHLTEEGNGTVFHRAGVDEKVARACQLQPKIDTWAEGSVISLENGSLVIYGRKLPYATLYARMMADVSARTQGMSGLALTHRVQEIQKEWQAKKIPAEDLQAPEQDAELTFVLARGGRLALLDDGGEVMARVGGPLHMPATVHGAPVTKSPRSIEDAEEPVNDAQAASDLLSTTPAQADDDTESLHVGDKIRVGYDSRHRPPMAFVSYRTARPSSVIAIDQEGKR